MSGSLKSRIGPGSILDPSFDLGGWFIRDSDKSRARAAAQGNTMATSGMVAVLAMKRLCRSVTVYGFGAVPHGKAPYQVSPRPRAGPGRGREGLGWGLGGVLWGAWYPSGSTIWGRRL